MANEKQKMFDDLIKGINSSKKYSSNDASGKLLAKLSDKPLNVNTISSGSMVLDEILGGGLAQGRLIEIYGAESSGKTSIALTALGNVQKDGGTAVFIDAENALDPKYAAKLGVNLAELAVAQPDSAEQALNLMQDLIESGVVDIIVLDSIAALVPQAELDGDAGDHTIGLVARLLSKQLKKMIKPANQTNTTVLFINQTRDAIGSFSPFGTPQTTTGGKAMKFYASQRIEIKRGQQVKNDSGTGDSKEIIGNQVKFKIVKNKVAPPFGTGESVLTFNQGINIPAEIMEVGVQYGIVEKPNLRTYVEVETGEVFGKSKAEALDRLKNDEELLNRLIKASKKKITDDLFQQDTSSQQEEEEDFDEEE